MEVLDVAVIAALVEVLAVTVVAAFGYQHCNT